MTRKRRGFTLIELLVVIAIIGVLAAILVGTLNALPAIVERGGRIRSVDRETDDDGHDDVYRYEAEIFNQEGLAIGRLRGGRVEGFGTMEPRIHWYKTPGVPEEMPERARRGRRSRN